MSYSDEREQSRKQWVKEAMTARRQMAQLLLQTPPQHIGPWDPLTGHNQMYALQHALVEYASYVAPRSNEVEEQWTETIETVQIPKSGVVDAGQTNVFGEIKFEEIDLPTRSIEISLSNLDEWGAASVGITFITTEHGGYRVIETKNYTPHIPLAGIRQLRRKLDNCLSELGWVPESEEKDTEAARV